MCGRNQEIGLKKVNILGYITWGDDKNNSDVLKRISNISKRINDEGFVKVLLKKVFKIDFTTKNGL